MEISPVESCPSCMSTWIHALISAQTLPRSAPALSPVAFEAMAVQESDEEEFVDSMHPSSGIIAAVAPIHPGEPPRTSGTLLDILG